MLKSPAKKKEEQKPNPDIPQSQCEFVNFLFLWVIAPMNSITIMEAEG